MERLLTVQETAAYLQVKPSTIYTWAYRSQIPCQKVCGVLRFRREDVEAWLQTQARKPIAAITLSPE